MFQFKDREVNVEDITTMPEQARDFGDMLKTLQEQPNFKNTVLCELMENCGEKEPIALPNILFADAYDIFRFYTGNGPEHINLAPAAVNAMLDVEQFLGFGRKFLDAFFNLLQHSLGSNAFDLNDIQSPTLRTFISNELRITMNNLKIQTAAFLPVQAIDNFMGAIFDHIAHPRIILTSVNTFSFKNRKNIPKFQQYLERYGQQIRKIIFNSKMDSKFAKTVMKFEQSALSNLGKIQICRTSKLLSRSCGKYELAASFDWKTFAHKYDITEFIGFGANFDLPFQWADVKIAEEPNPPSEMPEMMVGSTLCRFVTNPKSTRYDTIKMLNAILIPHSSDLKEAQKLRKLTQTRLADTVILPSHTFASESGQIALLVNAINPFAVEVSRWWEVKCVLYNMPNVKKLSIRISADFSPDTVTKGVFGCQLGEVEFVLDYQMFVWWGGIGQPIRAAKQFIERGYARMPAFSIKLDDYLEIYHNMNGERAIVDHMWELMKESGITNIKW